MASLQAAELATRLASPLFLLGNEVCEFDATGCRRCNPRHWLQTAHPVGRTLPRCKHLLSFQRCLHLDHRCRPSCPRPCPERAAAAEHCAEYTHCPSLNELERVANGEDPDAHVFKRVRTETRTTTTTTTTTSTEIVESVPRRVLSGGKLADSFIVPPFSVLDAKAGYWQARKREWFAPARA